MSARRPSSPRAARRRTMLAAIAALAGLLAAACGDSAASSPDDNAQNMSPTSTTVEQPVAGGTLSIGQYSPLNSLDPIGIPGTALAGQNEGDALYDVLMRFDDATKSYVPQLAASLTPNADFTEWTLKLRDGVTFSDGTPLDAAAVVTNINRHKDANRSYYTPALVAPITGMRAADATTVVFTLDGSSPGFPRVLASQPGLIAAPSYLAKVDGGDNTATPVGAGPFTIETFRPNEVISMVRNAGYWGTAPHLDRLRFVFIPGGTATVQAIQSGQLDAAVVYDPPAVKKAKDAGFEHHEELVSLGQVVLMNNASSSVLHDVRLREAVAKALDPKLINDRLYQGTADAGSQLFHQGSRWYDPKAEGVPYDPARAKTLVEQVKRDTGWDGTIRFLCHNGPDAVNYPTTVKSLLEPAGFKVQTKNDLDISTMIAGVFVKRDFDLACFGISVPDSDPYEALFEQFDSNQQATNQIGYADPEMDQALVDLRVARNDDQRRAVLTKVNTVWNRTYPLVNVTTNAFTTTYAKKVHGLRYSSNGVALFDQAWLAK